MTKVLIIRDSDGFGVFDVDAPADDIIQAVNHGRAEVYLPEVRGRFYARRQADVVVITGAAGEILEPRPHVSRREREILVLLGEGLTTAQIAIRLQVSQRTIRGYVTKMKKRLNALNVQQLVARAVALGIFHPEV